MTRIRAWFDPGGVTNQDALTPESIPADGAHVAPLSCDTSRSTAATEADFVQAIGAKLPAGEVLASVRAAK